MNGIVAAGLTMLVLSGCASQGPMRADGAPVSAMDAGPAPKDPAAAIQPFLHGFLKDPYSAQIKIVSGPSFFTQKSGLLGSAVYGWGICFDVNAKNSYGGYTGYKRMAVVWRDGVVLRHYEKSFADAACAHIWG